MLASLAVVELTETRIDIYAQQQQSMMQVFKVYLRRRFGAYSLLHHIDDECMNETKHLKYV